MPVLSLTTSVSFHVHLLEGLLNVLHVMRGVTHQHRALPEVAAQDADLIVGSERSRERPRCGVAGSTGVKAIALAAGDILPLARVHEVHVDALLGEQFERRNP
jgi:hypothetical protein